jgi:hypothetical protein
VAIVLGLVTTVGCEPLPTAGADSTTADASLSDGGVDDPSSARCGRDEHVVEGRCVACAAGTTNDLGDDPSGADTRCEVVRCARDERVEDHRCVTCRAGERRDAGDDASGPDTSCEAIRCGADEHVHAHRCVACAPGTGNLAGDDATGPDTSCDGLLCPSDQRVSSGECAACPPGTTNVAGDDVAGPDTSCDAIFCAVNEHVAGNACVPCSPGTLRPAGDDASGQDTSCAVILCSADEHVAAHECVVCPDGTTNSAGDSAAGANTTCEAMLCALDERVLDHACVACPAGQVNAAGDDASGGDSTCHSDCGGACAATEICGNACDDDCNGSTEEACPAPTNTSCATAEPIALSAGRTTVRGYAPQGMRLFYRVEGPRRQWFVFTETEGDAVATIWGMYKAYDCERSQSLYGSSECTDSPGVDATVFSTGYEDVSYVIEVQARGQFRLNIEHLPTVSHGHRLDNGTFGTELATVRGNGVRGAIPAPSCARVDSDPGLLYTVRCPGDPGGVLEATTCPYAPPHPYDNLDTVLYARSGVDGSETACNDDDRDFTCPYQRSTLSYTIPPGIGLHGLYVNAADAELSSIIDYVILRVDVAVP